VSLLAALVPVMPVLEKVFDRVFPNPEDKAKAQLELLKMTQAGEFRELDSEDRAMQGQIEINKIEAASESLYKSGWRPAVGWMCVLALACQYFFVPLLSWVATNKLGWAPPPKLDVSELIALLFALLGVSGLRSYDKRRRA
jgi:hypothetical protein